MHQQSPSLRKVVIVTGAGSGIGRELALQGARKGFAVIAVTKHADHLDDLVKEVALDGGTCVPLALDITSPDAPARIIRVAQDRFGRIDVIFNVAGYATAGRLLEQTDAQIDEQWQVHFAGPLRLMRAAYPMLLQSHGHVFFTGSGLARVPAPYYGAYCAAKAAVRAGVTQLRRELHGTGIAVTYIDPGSVHTGFAKTAGIETMGPSWVSAKAQHVAARILRGIDSRPKRLNAVWWHTLFAMLGEWFPGMTDKSFVGAPEPKGHGEASLRQGSGQAHHREVSSGDKPCHPEQASAQHADAVVASTPLSTGSGRLSEVEATSDFEKALEPIARRLERVKLSQSFLAQLLQTNTEVHLSEAAMRWAGMPNKNERAALAEALDALTNEGFLEKTGEETWRVLRAPA